MNTKCTECRVGDVHVEVAPYRYAAGGLPHVILLGVGVGRCLNCGAETLSVPRIAQLHRVLATTLATKATRLTANEARFLRKYLGHSTADLAAIMGIAPETVSRWESARSPQFIGATSERVLRLMVLRDSPVEEYPTAKLAEIHDADGDPTLRFESDGAGWHKAA